MFYRIQGLPEEGEIILCKVTKIYPNSVFVDLLEYGESGIIHISEISPGRIRNLRDFVSENRQIVCKVLRVDTEKKHIDLSLRRVNSTQRRDKLEEIKQELKSEQLITNLAKKLNLPPEKLYAQVAEKILTEYSYLHQCFHDLAEGKISFTKLGLPEPLTTDLTAAVIEKFRPKTITLKGIISLKTYDAKGIDNITSTLQEIERVSKTITLFYVGAGMYKLTIEDTDYKPAERALGKVQLLLEKFNNKNSIASFTREKE